MPWTGVLNNNLFLIVLEAGKSMIEVPADPLPGEGTHLSLLMAILSLYIQGERGREREREKRFLRLSL